jgi:hypothetical protein
MNSWTDAIWLFSEMNSNAEALTARVPEPSEARAPAWITGHSPSRATSGPRRHVEDRDHLQRPERATVSWRPVSLHLDEARRAGPDLPVLGPQVGEDTNQLAPVHADVAMEDRPPDLEHADEVVTDEKVVGQRRSGFVERNRGAPPR